MTKRHASSGCPRWAFASAVVVLALNDWLFKGAGILPTWLTGKLSDVAGLVVAPVVLAWLLGLARVPFVASRVLAVAGVGLAFAAIKLSGAAAGALDGVVGGVTRALGVPLAARTVPDATDLLAMPALAVAWWLTPPLAEDRTVARTGALVAGLLACAATSPAYVRLPPHWAFADEHQGRIWGARLDAGAMVVRFGRQSDDGAFEIGVELAGREGPLSLDARKVVVDVPGQHLGAEIPPDQDAVIETTPGESASGRLVFRPRPGGWPMGARGTLVMSVVDAGRDRTVQLPLSFDERIIAWRDRLELR